jgi:hypothetical protein
MAIIFIPKPLREKLGEEGTEALVQVLNENDKELRSSIIDFAEQKFEQALSREVGGVRVDLADAEKRFEKRLIEEISGVRIDLSTVEKALREEISGVRVDLVTVEKALREEISGVQGSIGKSKSDTIKWMFLFWIGQIGVLTGILFAVFK